MQDLGERLRVLQGHLPGCESLSVATRDGFVLATTIDDGRSGELLAAVTSVVVASCKRGLAPFRAGECRSLDFRGDRQILLLFLGELDAYLIMVLHPGATPINADEPLLRGTVMALPDALHGSDVVDPPRYFLQRDEACLIPIRNGITIGKDDSCDVVVPGKRVEPVHLRFEVLSDKILIRDLETQHGSKLNRKSFTGTIEISPGDRISLPKAGGFTVVAKRPAGKLRGLTGRHRKS